MMQVRAWHVAQAQKTVAAKAFYNMPPLAGCQSTENPMRRALFKCKQNQPPKTVVLKVSLLDWQQRHHLGPC